MDWFEALVLGLLQGLTEYLPVSSSGHLAIGSALFGIRAEESMAFTIAVHVATVLSTLVILWKEVAWLFKDLGHYCAHPSDGLNGGTRYTINIIISMIPVGIIGLFFKDKVEEVTGNKVTAESLAESIRLINGKRKALERLYETRKNDKLPISGRDVLLISQIAFYDDPGRFTQMTNKLCDELEQRIADGVSVFPEGTKRIMLTGTPMAIPNWKIHNIVETSGGAVVCEEMCTGTRYFEKQVDESGQTIDEEIQALANRYMNINCACFTPNTGRIDDILRLAKEYKVDGIIDINLKFCNLYDTEGYLVEKAMNEAGIPVLGIETDYTDSDAQQLRTRISAFIEMLNN